MSKSYTWDEIRKHNRPGDCTQFFVFCEHANFSAVWLVIKGKVYDVSAFASEHPGGEDLLLVSTITGAKGF